MSMEAMMLMIILVATAHGHATVLGHKYRSKSFSKDRYAFVYLINCRGARPKQIGKRGQMRPA
jgi:hypothetical protein